MSIRFLAFSRLLINEKLDANINALNFNLDSNREHSRTAALAMSNNPEAIKVIAERDRDEILRLFSPTHELFNVNYYIITDSEGLVLARTHEPGNYGDSVVNQRSIKDALEGRSSSYYEQGIFVKVSVCTGAPVYDADGNIIGVISAGVRFDIDDTVDNLKHLLNAEVTVFLGDTRIATTLMIDGQRAKGTVLDSHIAQTLIEDQREYSGKVELFGLSYEAYYKPLMNADNETFAIVFLGIPIHDLEVESNTLLIQVIIIGVLCFSISMILLNAFRNAMAASRAKSSFLANMSHEIRTPINAIIGMTTIAESSTDMERKNYAIGNVKAASVSLLNIVNDILDISKIEANKMELAPAECNLEKTLQNAANVLSLRIAEKNQRFSVEYDNNIPDVLICDDKRLMQVIINILGNAVKFTPENGAITLKASLVKTENNAYVIQFDICDTGIGITKEQQARLFNSFEQAETDTTRKFGGTGLGLAISKRIVEMMGGRVWLVSEIGKGSVFSFTIPAKGKAPSTDSAASPAGGLCAEAREAEAMDCFKGYRVLLVEDNEINKEIVISLLEPTFLEIDCAENGVEAVEKFANNCECYDLIFMDIQMPEMDGYEATRRIRALDTVNSKGIPIIALSANMFSESIEESIRSGMNAHIGKPLDFDEVLSVLRKFLSA
ncbi:MAG: ATP-binding protein [Oscillospiraceae bacterium]|nr:ATP-binding protein [Oscillospiraceae bacterium]